jgi:hypothetical protein
MKMLSKKDDICRTCNLYAENEYIEVCWKHGEMRCLGYLFTCVGDNITFHVREVICVKRWRGLNWMMISLMLKINWSVLGRYVLFLNLLIWSHLQWHKAHLVHHQNPSNGFGVEICGRTDRQGWTQRRVVRRTITRREMTVPVCCVQQ